MRLKRRNKRSKMNEIFRRIRKKNKNEEKENIQMLLKEERLLEMHCFRCPTDGYNWNETLKIYKMKKNKLGMRFALDKCAKSTFKKDKLVKTNNIMLDEAIVAKEVRWYKACGKQRKR